MYRFPEIKKILSSYEFKYNDDYIVCLKDDDIFKVSSDFTVILQLIETSVTLKDTVNSLSNQGHTISEKDVINIMNAFIEKLKTEGNKKNKSYTNFDITILSGLWISNLAKNIKFLYTPILFFKWIIALYIITMGLIFYSDFSYFNLNANFITQHIWGSLFLCFILYITHEFGHICAACLIEQKRYDIKFAMYIFFPVFYVDLNTVWKGTKTQKCVVNLAGYGTQLLVTIFILLLSIIYNSEWLYMIGVISTFGCFIGAFLPFGRTDGYWLWSDILNKENLQTDFNALSKKGLKNIFAEFNTSNNKFIVVYGIINALLVSIVLTLILYNNWYNLVNLPFSLYKYIKNTDSIIGFFSNINLDITMVWIGFFFVYLLCLSVKIFKYSIKKILSI